MRWVVKLGAFGATVVVLHRVAAAAPLEARATLALGFLLCAAWLGAQLAQRTRLPYVAGFLLVGFAIGPAWLNGVRADELAALSFIGEAGLALVTLGAGAALSVAAIAQARRPLARLAAGTIALPFVVTTLVVLSVSHWFPLTIHQPFGSGAVAALALATLATTASPTLTIATIDDPRSAGDGAFAHATLTLTVLKDVVAVVLLAVVLGLAGWAASAGVVRAGLGLALLERAIASLAAGALLGLLLDHYLQLPRSDTAVALGAFAFAATLFARLLELDGTLIALAAGGVVANRTLPDGVGSRLRTALRNGTVPVYAVSFTLMGAGLRVQALEDMWPWMLLLLGVRTLTLRYGTLWAGRDPSVAPVIARDGWVGLISQGGIVLALAAAVRRAFPAWGVSFESLVAALVALNTLAGPVAFARLLERLGPGARQDGAKRTLGVGGEGEERSLMMNERGGAQTLEQLNATPVM